MSAPNLAQVLDALGGFRPPEELPDRMRAFEQTARFCLKLKGHRPLGRAMRGTGHLVEIAKRDFGLSKAQHRVCVQLAKDFLLKVKPLGKSSDEAVAEVRAGRETSNVQRSTFNVQLLQKAA